MLSKQVSRNWPPSYERLRDSSNVFLRDGDRLVISNFTNIQMNVLFIMCVLFVRFVVVVVVVNVCNNLPKCVMNVCTLRCVSEYSSSVMQVAQISCQSTVDTWTIRAMINMICCVCVFPYLPRLVLEGFLLYVLKGSGMWWPCEVPPHAASRSPSLESKSPQPFWLTFLFSRLTFWPR